MTQHPLALLRASLGLPSRAYSQLVAETHAKLGFGHMAARREKVSRWESGRTVPEIPAQLAIAHIHQVSEADVLRLGWPRWLYLPSGDALLLSLPWTREGAVDALHNTVHLTDPPDRSYLALSGDATSSLIAQWNAAVVTAPLLPQSCNGRRITSDTLTWLTSRLEALEKLVWTVSPAALYPSARSELGLVAELLSQHSYSQRTGAGLLLLSARSAGLCGRINISMGSSGRAERYFLAATRAAAAAESPQLAAAYLAGVAHCHLNSGAPRDVCLLVEAARAAVRPQPYLAALLHLLEARARARLGEASLSLRALDRAGITLTDHAAQEDRLACPATSHVDTHWATACAGVTWLHLDRPKQALEHLAPLFDDRDLSRFVCYSSRELIFAVDALLALGEVEAAVHSACRAASLDRALPAETIRQYRTRFSAHRTVPSVRQFLDLLADRAAH